MLGARIIIKVGKAVLTTKVKDFCRSLRYKCEGCGNVLTFAEFFQIVQDVSHWYQCPRCKETAWNTFLMGGE